MESAPNGGSGNRSRWIPRPLSRLDAALPIGVKLVLPVLAVVIAAGVILTWTTYRTEAQRIRHDFEDRALLLTETVEVAAGIEGASRADWNAASGMQTQIDAVAQLEASVLRMDVYAFRAGQPAIIASSDPARVGAAGAELEDAREDLEAILAPEPIVQEEELAGEPALEITSAVGVEGQTMMVVGAYFSTAERDDELAALLRTFALGVGGSLILLAIVVFSVLRTLLLGRMHRLLVAAERMEAGEYSARVEGAPSTESRDEMLRLSLRFNSMAEAIETLHAKLEDLATTDGLTGLYNRRYLAETLEREISRSRRNGQPLSAIILDLDGLKAVNDRHGHAIGDEVLRRAAQALRGAIREGDVAARYGGDEFAVVLRNCDSSVLRNVLQRIRGDVEALAGARAGDGRTIRFTVSGGGAVLAKDESAESLLQRADLALYEAKKAGRNRVLVAA